MRFSLATNFDDALVDGLPGTPVTELYGKLHRDCVGGGRPSIILAPVSRRELERHVARARARGLGFNYLLSGSCLDNAEVAREGQRALRALLDWICAAGVESVTVSNPFLLRMVRRSYPSLRTRVSVFAGVDCARKARFWEDEGADVLTLPSQFVNREFETLRRVRAAVACGLELLVNGDCLVDCFMAQTHGNLLAHASQSGPRERGFQVDHCILTCRRLKMEDPAKLLMSDWIRPEDLHCYEELGYDRFKLIERQLPTADLLSRVKAYAERRFDGNLMDLVYPDAPHRHKDSPRTSLYKLAHLLHPLQVNLPRLARFRPLFENWRTLREHVRLENRALDGFIDHFRESGCRQTLCGTACRHCHDYAERAVRIDPAYRRECLRLCAEADEAMLSGRLWDWF